MVSKMSSGEPLISFDIYIKRIHKNMGRDLKMSQNALEQISSLLNVVGSRLVDDASNLCIVKPSKQSKSSKIHVKRLSAREIQSAVKLNFTEGLAKNAVSEGTKAIVKHTSSHTVKTAKKKSSADKAGITFPPSRAENMIRLRHTSSVGKEAPVYLAGVLDYLTAEIIELAGNACINMKRKTISPRCIQVAILNDEELASLMHTIDWSVAGGGVMLK